MLHLTVEDIMDEHPITVKENMDVGSVTHLLLRYGINGVLVVKKKSEREVMGLFTTADLLQLFHEKLSHKVHRMRELASLSRLPVGKVVNTNVISIEKSTKVTKAIALMHKKNIGIIPVYEGKKLIGIIRRRDILDVALHQY